MTGIVPPGIQFTKAQLASMDQFQIKDGVLVHLFQPRARNIHQYHPIITQICVPKKLRGRILSQYHDSIISGGHQAFDRTFQAIRQKYFWKNYYRDIYEYQKSCMQCQRASNRKPAKAPLKPLSIVGLFDRWSIDYLGPYRQSKCKKKYILMAVDSLSGWCEAFPIEKCDAVSTAQVLYSELFSKKGAPKSLLSDRGSNFLSSLIQALCDIFRIPRLRTSSYHPASNGRVERFNSFINKSLRTAIDDRQENWPSVIPGVMMAYRSTPATHSTEFSPFVLCYGKEMNIPIDNAINPDITEVAPNYRDTLKLFVDNVNLARKIAAKIWKGIKITINNIMIRLQLNPNTDLVTWYFCMIPLPLLVFQRNSNQDGWDHIASVRWVPITPIAWDITILMYQLLLSLTVSASNRPDCHGKVKLEDRRETRELILIYLMINNSPRHSEMTKMRIMTLLIKHLVRKRLTIRTPKMVR